MLIGRANRSLIQLIEYQGNMKIYVRYMKVVVFFFLSSKVNDRYTLQAVQ
jgi:hypothetical protein